MFKPLVFNNLLLATKAANPLSPISDEHLRIDLGEGDVEEHDDKEEETQPDPVPCAWR